MASANRGRNAPRSKNGCSTCRIRKIKCDEERPVCSKCSQAGIGCEWNRPLPPRRPAANYSAKRRGSHNMNQIQPEPAIQAESVISVDEERRTRSLSVGSSLVILNHAPDPPSPTLLASKSIQMPNSLILSPQDLKAFRYIPKSLMVLRFGKPWGWSMFRYLHKMVAPRECGVMSAFIAVACMELRFRDLVQFTGNTITHSSLGRALDLRNSAAKFFHMAIKQLSLLLDRVARAEPSPEETEALFSMWFLILHCELYDPELIRASQIHLYGIRSFLGRYLKNEDGSKTRKLPPAAQQLLLFITYMDVNLALSDLNGGQLCLDLVSIPQDSPLAYDRIWESARTCLPRLWGVEYPAEEILDDIENYRGLSFLQAIQKLKLSVWQLAVAERCGSEIQASRLRLWNRIEEIGDDFIDVLRLGQYAKNSGGRRVMWTVYHACLDYYAVKLLFSCLDKDDPSPEWLENALADLLAIAHKSLDEDPQQLYRTSWPLAVALLKVRDPIHRDWIQEQLKRARVLLSGVGLPQGLLDGPRTPGSVHLDYHNSNALQQLGNAA